MDGKQIQIQSLKSKVFTEGFLTRWWRMNYIICFPTSFPEKFIFISFPTKFLLCKAVSEISYLKIVTNAGSLFFYYFINFSKTPFLSLFCSLFILSSLFISQLLPLNPLCLSAKKKDSTASQKLSYKSP